jgi:hypothetical protein
VRIMITTRRAHEYQPVECGQPANRSPFRAVPGR